MLKNLIQQKERLLFCGYFWSVEKREIENNTFVDIHTFYKCVCHYCVDSSMMKLVVRENPVSGRTRMGMQGEWFSLDVSAPRG